MAEGARVPGGAGGCGVGAMGLAAPWLVTTPGLAASVCGSPRKDCEGLPCSNPTPQLPQGETGLIGAAVPPHLQAVVGC